MTDAERRHLGESKKFGRRYSAVSGDNLSGVIDKDGRNKAEGLNAVRNLPNLLAGMRARIPLAGRELRHRDHFETAVSATNDIVVRRCRARDGVISIYKFHFLVTSVLAETIAARLL